ncbi:glycosyltransferase [Hyphomonas sp.]|uniref:glycosyltransferase family 4 protein n=1 Tax=Hyphomonas sp. TaxID=87 RepID=UPI0025C157B1|nr:glycosyltransferase [Hyphomonas sp.]MBI1399411.1 glycosyltransferase [Hyphomonas sp.]
MTIRIVQPALPAYRVGLFKRLADRFAQDLVVYASRSEDLGELDSTGASYSWSSELGPIKQIVLGLEWQEGAASIPISKHDVLVVCGAPRTLSTLLLMVKARLRGTRTIWWGHYWSASSKPWRAYLRLALMQAADAVVFYTDQEVAEYKKSALKKPVRRVAGLNNGIETNEIQKMRESFVARLRPRDFLFLGRLTEKAQLPLLLRAMASPECRNLTLDVIGDGPERRALVALAEELRISDRVVWHGATTDESKISGVANCCKAFVYPGSVGLSLIHAMAYGLPAIVHDDRWTHMPEIAAHSEGYTGVSYSKNSLNSLAATMSGLIANHARLEGMSNACVSLIDSTFNLDDMAQRFVRAIEEIEVP